MKLNTEDLHLFVYEERELRVELLGSVRMDTLERMRVTIKVSVTNMTHPQYTSEAASLAVRITSI